MQDLNDKLLEFIDKTPNAYYNMWKEHTKS